MKIRDWSKLQYSSLLSTNVFSILHLISIAVLYKRFISTLSTLSFCLNIFTNYSLWQCWENNFIILVSNCLQFWTLKKVSKLNSRDLVITLVSNKGIFLQSSWGPWRSFKNKSESCRSTRRNFSRKLEGLPLFVREFLKKIRCFRKTWDGFLPQNSN